MLNKKAMNLALAGPDKHKENISIYPNELWPEKKIIDLIEEAQDTVAAAKNTGISPKVLEEIVFWAEKYGICRLILFGSRARGDYYKTSDIDLAVSGGDISRFSLSVDEETSTLLKFDFVNLDRAVQPELRASIEREGVILYEKV